MAMNNPYAAYQRYATNSQASQNAVKANNEALVDEAIVGIASTDGTKSPQLQSPVTKSVNYSQ